jgi:hypothetical protein
MGTGISLGIGIPFRRMGAGIDPQAQAHYNRVIADGGLIPSGLVGVNNFFKTVKGIYGTSDITTAISVGLDAQVLGYKLGAGAGTTAGQAAQKLYSCSGSSGDVVQTTAASQPLLLVHSGANYFFQSANTDNYCRTPNATANQITGDIEIIVKAAPINWATDYGMFVAKNSGGLNGWCFFTRSSKRLGYVSTRGEVVSTVGHTFVNNEIGWVKVTHDTALGIVKFFTSNDGITYTQLGSNVSTTAGATTNQNINVEIGTNAAGGNQLGGKVYSATISNSIGGTPVVDFNPNQYNAATSQTQWTSSTGEVWTINTGTATTGYKGVLVDRTITMGDGVDDSLESLSPLVSQPDTIYFSNRIVSSGGGWIIDGLSGSRQIINKLGADIQLFAGSFASASISVSLRNLLTSVFNGASSQIQLNNGTATTGLNTGTKFNYSRNCWSVCRRNYFNYNSF